MALVAPKEDLMLHRPANPLDTPRMSDRDIATVWAWLVTDGVMDQATRNGIAALLREVERARAAESAALKKVEELGMDSHSHIAWTEGVD